jgi:hypothetical protein
MVRLRLKSGAAPFYVAWEPLRAARAMANCLIGTELFIRHATTLLRTKTKTSPFTIEERL